MNYSVTFEHSTGSECGILLPNHLAASLEDAMGDRAQNLSTRFHMPVFGYERPSTAELPSIEPLEDVEQYFDSIEEQAIGINRRLDMFGINRVLLVGNSAGGIDALALAASGILNIEHLIVMEPVGTRKVPKAYALKYLKSQQEKDREEMYEPEFDALEVIGNIRQPITKATNVRRGFKEIKAYDEVFRSNVGIKLLRKIASEQPDLPVDFILGGRSLATTRKMRSSLQAEFSGSSVNLEIYPRAKHSFPNRIHYFLHIIDKTMQRVAEPVVEVESIA
ncbi:MAG TPA: alpha/beta hydrolase [Candidatus Saccharimonadales bacterium]